MNLARLIARFEWTAAALFLFLRPLVTGPLTDLDARFMNLLLVVLSWSPLLLALLRFALVGDAGLAAPRFLAPAGACLAALGLAAGAAGDRAFAIPRLAELGGALPSSFGSRNRRARPRRARSGFSSRAAPSASPSGSSRPGAGFP